MSMIILEHCPGCGKCVNSRVCPIKAISIDNGKAVIGKGCIECGLCLPICPIGLIKLGEQENKQPVKIEREVIDHEQQTSTGA
ncbi:4Fe-4S dicluster domain-containing protein [Desulfosporosinus sp. FKA]|uniref:4Fe-4S dicluster domain-containing protein n=1 Tax=Desulfosporosinus sp. FKA TaxID=1969834 RepID=UPI001FA8AA65|nr:4Fe-4S dicluster domain-containing protein [Desulfosporosinus sp. FKA]